jgi:hypothetical protein
MAAHQGPGTKLTFTMPNLDRTLSFAEFEGFRHGLIGETWRDAQP